MKKCFIIALCFQLIASEAFAMQSLAAVAQWCGRHKKLLTGTAAIGGGALTFAWHNGYWPFAKPVEKYCPAKGQTRKA